MIASRHSTVSANASYQQSTTKSECNRYAALGIKQNKVSETSVPTIKSTSTAPTTNLTQDSMREVTINIEKLELKVKKEQTRSEYHEKFMLLNEKVNRLTETMGKQRAEIRYWKSKNVENKKTIDDMKKLVETLKEEVQSFTTTEYSDIFNNEDWDLMDFDESPTTTTTTTPHLNNPTIILRIIIV